MYQSVRLTLALTLVLFAKNSRQSSDLLTYQIHSSNQEISYFINYLDHLFHILNQTLSEYEIETPANRTGELVRNSTCFNHIEHSILMARKETPWAIQMFDSIGKPTSGIMENSFSFLGLYSECLSISNDLFNGQYCLATISLPAATHQMFRRYSGKRDWSSIQAKLGICAPSSCSLPEIASFTNRVLSKLINGSEASFTNCYEREMVNERPTAYYISLYVLLGFVAIVLVATFYDYYLITKESERILQAQNCQKISIDSYFEQCSDNSYLASSRNQIFTLQQATASNQKIGPVKTGFENRLPAKALLCFSAIKNSKKLFNTDTQPEGSIGCLDGLKVLCMLWIIIGHSYSFGIQWLFFSNPNYFRKASEDLFSQIFANGTLAVDVFFFISGILVCSSALKIMKKADGRLNIGLFYLYRYLRIAPLMLITILFSANILRTLAEGPVWLESITMYDSWCKDNWWINVLHLHNFINREHMCLSHSWYTAVDLQFYMLSPLILIPLYKRPKWGIGILVALLTASIAVTATLTAVNDYPAIPYLNADSITQSKLNDYFGWVYIKPWSRIGPFLIGVLFGYLMYRGYTKAKISTLMHWTLTFASITTLCAILFSMQDANNGIKPSVAMASFYSSCARTLFAVCLAYFVFCFINGRFTMLNTLLSAKIIQPFSRVSYSAYLLHPLIMAVFYGSREQSFIFSNYLMFYFIIGHLFVTYIVSFAATILFESPFINLSRLFLK